VGGYHGLEKIGCLFSRTQPPFPQSKKHKHPTLPFQETRGTIIKNQKGTFGKTRTPNLYHFMKNDVSIQNKKG
jgi:hypothetical protein